MARVKWQYYLRDDTLVFRANLSSCEFFGIIGWEPSSICSNEATLLRDQGKRLEKVSAHRVRFLIST